MKQTGFGFEVKASVIFTKPELDMLRDVGSKHYDHFCRKSTEPNGFLYGWDNYFRFATHDEIQVRATFEELDLCLKILEQASYHDYTEAGNKLYSEIHMIVKAMQAKNFELITQEAERQAKEAVSNLR